MKKWLGLLLVSALASTAAAETYQIDPVHTTISFSVKHMVISRVEGRFDKFSGSVTYVPGKPKLWKAEAHIDAASIDTRIKMRDDDVRSDHFLDVKKYPEIVFKSKKVEHVKGNTADLLGDLTIHGVTKPVILKIKIGGVVKDPWGNQRLGAVAETSINRKDFGLMYNKVLESGGLLVGNRIKIKLDVEAIIPPKSKK
jgi:polyisoprenoid-binding protein YceI